MKKKPILRESGSKKAEAKAGSKKPSLGRTSAPKKKPLEAEISELEWGTFKKNARIHNSDMRFVKSALNSAVKDTLEEIDNEKEIILFICQECKGISDDLDKFGESSCCGMPVSKIIVLKKEKAKEIIRRRMLK